MASGVTGRKTITLFMTGLVATIATGQSFDLSWTFGNVGSSSYRLDAFFPENIDFGSLGSEDPTLPLQVGQRYEIIVTVWHVHPLEIIAKGRFAEEDVVLMSMATKGAFESDPEVGWVQQGQDRVSFTLTAALHEAMRQGGRTPGYRCRPHRFNMRGDFTVSEPMLQGETAPLANITWVTEAVDRDGDGVQDDQGFIDLLTGAGYLLDVRPDRYTALEGQDANDTTDYVAELNAADLVIISRTSSSGNYDDGNEPAMWNSVTAPLIQMSSRLLRTSRWSWMNTTDSARSNLSFMEVLDPTHPIFAGVEVDQDGLVEPVDPLAYDEAAGYQGLSFVPHTDAGNGTLLGAGLEGYMWIAEWAEGVEFFEGASQFATGHRLAFMAGTENASLGTGVFPQGGNTLTAAGTQMFLNAVAYMIPDPPAPLTATLTGAAAGTDSSATGSAVFQPDEEGTALSYVLGVTGLENIRMAHIHVSEDPGGNGGVVVWLYPAGPPASLVPGVFTGVLGEGVITADSLSGSLAGQSLDALIQAIRENRAYVNVHTEQYGGGEIRGQIE